MTDDETVWDETDDGPQWLDIEKILKEVDEKLRAKPTPPITGGFISRRCPNCGHEVP